MRGKVREEVIPMWEFRITPAYAGKSCAELHQPGTREDHPRVCGEKCFHGSILPEMIGSPPRMR